jgi:hypothetical protein
MAVDQNRAGAINRGSIVDFGEAAAIVYVRIKAEPEMLGMR